MKRVLVTQRLPEGLRPQALTGGLVEFDVRDSDAALDPERLAEHLGGYQGVVSFLTDRLDARVLEANPQLEVVANIAVGYDNIDVAAADRLGMVVTNTPDVLTETTADLALALMLGVARRLPEADSFVRAGSWNQWELLPAYTGMDLHGGTLGILGMGKIGRAVARRAVHGFNMDLIYFGRSRMSDQEEREFNATRVDLAELMSRADVVSLHAPLTTETQHIIGARELAAMQPTAILVNTSRGPLVDEAALGRALAAGSLWGVGLDVFDDEPRVHPALLAERERVVLAPHIGSATTRTRRQMVSLAVENARAVLEGRGPRNPVSTGLGTGRIGHA